MQGVMIRRILMVLTAALLAWTQAQSPNIRKVGAHHRGVSAGRGHRRCGASLSLRLSQLWSQRSSSRISREPVAISAPITCQVARRRLHAAAGFAAETSSTPTFMPTCPSIRRRILRR